MPRHSGDLEADIAEVLNDCQKTFAVHRRGLASLHKIEVDQPRRFLEVYISFLNRILVVWKREPTVERLIQLTVSFAKEHLGFALGIVQFLLEHTGAKDRAVRFRTSQIIASIISALPEEAEFDDELWETISKRMLVRVKDKFPLVRIQAVYALRRLQDPSNAEDPVITELLHLCNSDSNKDVRRAALVSLGMFKQTVPSILKRTRDVKEDVRKTTFGIIAERMQIRQLSINQRIAVLQDGLEDRHNDVRAACQELLGTTWYLAVGSDPLKLLAALDVEVAESVCEKVVKELLKQHPEIVVKSPFNENVGLTKETSFLFRVTCDYYSEQKDADKLDALLPSTAEWCTAARAYLVSDAESDEFITRQVLLVLTHLDAQEEVGRQTMLMFVREFLPSPTVGRDVVSVLCKTLGRVCGTEDETMQCAIELLADMREPLDAVESGEGKAKADEQKEEVKAKQERIKALDIAKRQWQRREEKASKVVEATQEIEQLRAEVAEGVHTLKLIEECTIALRVRCIMICEHLLSITTKSVTHGSIAGLRESTILPGIRHSSPEVRLRAVCGLGLFALLDANAARADGQLLVQVARNDQENIREVALKALLDITLLFGVKVWAAPESTEEFSELAVKVFDVIMSSLEDDHVGLKTIAAEGVAKLLLADGLKDVEVFARLVALFFSPESSDMLLLRQCLSVFFPTYVVNPTHKVTVQKCFLPLVKVVLGSSRQSPLRKIPLANVFPFLMSLVPPPEKPTDEDRAVSSNLAVDLARVVLANPQGAEVKAVLKCIKQVGVAKDDQATVKRLRCLIDEAERYVKDKLTLRAMNQYAVELRALDETPDVELNADEALELVNKAKQLSVAAPLSEVPRGTVAKPPTKKAKKAAAKPKEQAKKKVIESESEASDSGGEPSDAQSEGEPAQHKKYSQESEEESNAAENSENSEEEAKEVIRVKKTTARSKAAAHPKRVARDSSSDEPQPKKAASQESEEETEPIAKKVAHNSAVAPKRVAEGESRPGTKKVAAQPRKNVIRDDSDSEAEREKQREKELLQKAKSEFEQNQLKAKKLAEEKEKEKAKAKTKRASVSSEDDEERIAQQPKKTALKSAAVSRAAAPKPTARSLVPLDSDASESVPPPTSKRDVTAAPTRPSTFAQKSAAPRTSAAPTTVASTRPTTAVAPKATAPTQSQRIHTSVKPPVPRVEIGAVAKSKSSIAASTIAPLRPLQKPAQPAPVSKVAVVRQMQGQIHDMLSSDDESERENPRAKSTAVRNNLQEIDGMLSD